MDENTSLEMILWGIDTRWFTPDANRRQAKYINDAIRFMAKREKGDYSTILDVPCGIGRLDNRLRAYGYQVTGVDSNSYFIAEAKRSHKIHAKDYIKADMRSFRSKKKFDVVLQWCASFGYYDDSGNLATLKSFSANLKKGGLLFLDFPSKSWHINHTNPDEWDAVDFTNSVKLGNTKIVRRRNQTFMVFTVKVYKKSGKNLVLRKKHVSPIRLYTQKEISDLLKNAGFEIRHSFSSRTFKNASVSDTRRILICIKTR